MNTTNAGERADTHVVDCWRTVGIDGDRTCPELERHVHCRNCPVLAQAARTFFDRVAPEGYLDSWRQVLEQPPTETRADTTTVLVFRIGKEWFALPASVLVEMTTPRRLHRLPHMHSRVLQGLVNIRGQLQLCVGLECLLGQMPDTREHESTAASRLLVVERVPHRWVIRVDEVAGVHRVEDGELRPVPATISAANAPLTAALFAMHGRSIGLLDVARLFDGLDDHSLA